MTMLAASIFVHSLDQALALALLASEQGADLVEFRVDRFTASPDAIVAMIEQSPLPAILTCRPVWEGGEYEGTEEDRLAIFEQACQAPRPPAWIDLELAAWRKTPAFRHRLMPLLDHPGQTMPRTCGLILSSHDFETRPTDLYQRIEEMQNEPACRVVKVAWRARSLRDNLEAFEVLSLRHKPTIALCMGEEGLASRVLAKKFGAMLTFASLDAAGATAPGQPRWISFARFIAGERSARTRGCWASSGIRWPTR